MNENVVARMVAQELYTAVWSLAKRETKINDNINVDVSVNKRRLIELD
jgi:hypothetical protein